MIELVLTVCLLAAEGQCKEVRLSFQDEQQFSTPYGCMIGGQIEITKWNESHPKYFVKRWSCRPAGIESDL